MYARTITYDSAYGDGITFYDHQLSPHTFDQWIAGILARFDVPILSRMLIIDGERCTEFVEMISGSPQGCLLVAHSSLGSIVIGRS